jgi:hypothetical protein
MVKEILYTTALDKNGNLIHIDNAKKGISYYCPLCNNDLILRKSGKTGKGSKRPHFAHNELTTNCTPEGVLHYSFKKMLIDLFEKYRSDNKTLVMNWICNYCYVKHSGNLLENVASIKEEYNLKVCQPDIALLDKEENVIAVIEIVVSHKPEEQVLEFYTMNNIILIQINLSSEEDLYDIEKKIVDPDIVNFCLNQQCSNYKNNKITREIMVFPEICQGCLRLKITSYIKVNHVFGIHNSIDFNENEIKTAESRGVNFEMRIDKKTNKKYHATICLNCKKIRRSSNKFRF